MGQNDVLKILRKKKDVWYASKEIARKIDISCSTCVANLALLIKEDLVVRIQRSERGHKLYFYKYKTKGKNKFFKKDFYDFEKREKKQKLKDWTKEVKERDKGCIICGETKNLNAHHILPREIKELIFDIDNGIALCPSHHKYSNKISAHKSPFLFFIKLWEERRVQCGKLLLKSKRV